MNKRSITRVRIMSWGEARPPLSVKLKHSFITLVHTNVITCNIWGQGLTSLGPLVLYAGDSGWSGMRTWIQNKKFGFGLPRRQLWHFYHTPPSNVPSQCCDICATHDKKRCRFLNNSFFSYQWLVRFIEKSYVLSVTKVWKWTYSILRERR
jgi:hypothetical protein